jgi:hypothetical protein
MTRGVWRTSVTARAPRVAARPGGAPAGVRLHRTRRLPPGDVTALDGMPITTVARTVADLADVVSHTTLARALHEAEVLRVLDVSVIADVLTRLPGRRGTAVLRRLLDETVPVAHTRSQLEECFLALVDRAGLPRPKTNVHLDAGDRFAEVDALWPEHRVIVELDGEHVHRTSKAFHADRARDAALAARGYVVVRLTWRRLMREPDAVADELRQVLDQRPAPCPPAPRP